MIDTFLFYLFFIFYKYYLFTLTFYDSFNPSPSCPTIRAISFLWNSSSTKPILHLTWNQYDNFTSASLNTNFWLYFWTDQYDNFCAKYLVFAKDVIKKFLPKVILLCSPFWNLSLLKSSSKWKSSLVNSSFKQLASHMDHLI